MVNDKYLFSLNIPNTNKPRVVVLGGGFGGINLAKKISDDFQLVLLDRYNYHTFQPLLYQVATAGLEPDSIAGPLRLIMAKKKDVYFRMLSAEYVSPENKTIVTTVGELTYDYLVIATGAKVNFFNNDSIARHAFPLKQITHALDLRSHIFQQFETFQLLKNNHQKAECLNFVVVGAGPTGVEVCGALAELKLHVLPKDYSELSSNDVKIYLVEGLDRVLPGMSEKSGEIAYQYLRKLGVNVNLNCLTEQYDGQIAKLNNGQEIKTNTLIWAAGVKGNIIKGFEEQSIQKGKLLVNEINQVIRNGERNEAYANIFAIGDVALVKHKDHLEELPGLAQVAIQQGKHLAYNLERIVKSRAPKAFRYKNKGVMATIGRNKAVADLPNSIHFKGFIGWFIWMAVHLLFLVGFRSKVVALINWVWNYFTYDRGVRLILRPSSKLDDIISQNIEKEMNEVNIQKPEKHE